MLKQFSSEIPDFPRLPDFLKLTHSTMLGTVDTPASGCFRITRCAGERIPRCDPIYNEPPIDHPHVTVLEPPRIPFPLMEPYE